MNAPLPYALDAEVPADRLAEMAATLRLKVDHLPEGYASVGGPCVRMHRLPGLHVSNQTSTITAAEARVWAELLVRAADEADEAIEEQQREEARDESGCELTPREVYGAGR